MNAGSWEEAVSIGQAVTQHESFGSLKDRDVMESDREQVIWRLQRLLGDQCDRDRVIEGAGRPSESVCTEDFARCFRDEMVELQQSDYGSQQRNHASEAAIGARFQLEEQREGENPEEPKEHLSDSYRAKTSEEGDDRGRLRADDLQSSKFSFICIYVHTVFFFSQIQIFLFLFCSYYHW